MVNFDDNGEITSYDADNSGPVPTNDEGLAALRAWTSGDAVADPVVVSTYEAFWPRMSWRLPSRSRHHHRQP